MKINWTRRNMLIGGGSVLATMFGASVFGYGLSSALCSKKSEVAANTQAMLAMVTNESEALAIGQAFRASHNISGTLDSVLSLSKPLRDACQFECSESAQEMLAGAFRDDFKAGRIEIFNNWVLSQSEALICAYWSHLADQKKQPQSQ